MGIIGKLKSISHETLALLRSDPLLVRVLMKTQYLPESPFWQRQFYSDGDLKERSKQEGRDNFNGFRDRVNPEGGFYWNRQRLKYRYDWQDLEQQFLKEWETPECDLHKYWLELTFFLSGYVPNYFWDSQRFPELKALVKKYRNEDFLPFLTIPNSSWDGLPLVNAFGAGTLIGYSTGYGRVRFLESEEAKETWQGLIRLSERGVRDRYWRESQRSEPCPWIDWSEPEFVDWLIEYYLELCDYYAVTVREKRGLLLYLT